MKQFNLEAFPTSESAKRMLSYVSDGFYDTSYVGKWLFQVIGTEYDTAREVVENLSAQLFPETATWGLMYHEIKWGLPVRQNLSYEERRRLIYQRRDYRAPMTPYCMEKYLEEVTGFEVHVADREDPGEYGFVATHPNVFKVYFLGEETLDVKRVFQILNHIKQSHTTYTINERIETRLDNKSLEQIWFRSLLLPMSLEIMQNEEHLSIAFRFWQDFHTTEDSWLRSLGLFWQIREDLLDAALEASRQFLRKLQLRFYLNFWNAPFLNGSRRLDGSRYLSGKRRYGVLLKVGLGLGRIRNSEMLRLSSVLIVWKQENKEQASLIRTSQRIKIKFWRNHDISALGESGYRMAASVSFHMRLISCRQEEIGKMTIETRSRNYRFLDGSRLLDGGRMLNSVYRKETIP